MSTCIGIVGGKYVYTSPDKSSVHTDPDFPIPTAGGTVIAIGRFMSYPMIAVLHLSGIIEMINPVNDSDRIIIDAAAEDLRGKTVRTAAMIEQIIAVAINDKIVVVPHSHPQSETPTWISTKRDATTFIRFTPDRARLISGHASGRVNSVDIHIGLLHPVQRSHKVLVPGAPDPKDNDAVVAAALLPNECVVVLTKDQVQYWKPEGSEIVPIAIRPPTGVGGFLDFVFLRGKMFVLCEFAVWQLHKRKRGERARLRRADGNVGWCIDVLGILVSKANHTMHRIKV